MVNDDTTMAESELSRGDEVHTAPEPSGLAHDPSIRETTSVPVPAQGHADDAPDADHPLAQDILLNPSRWRIWPAVAVLRWMLRGATQRDRRIVYRSRPSLSFAGSEIDDVAIEGGQVNLVLTAPGLAAPGSPLPTSDIARIMEDRRRGGALATWLDGPGDRFMHAVETAHARNNAAFALATGGRIEALYSVSRLVGLTAPLAAHADGRLADAYVDEPLGAVGLAGLFVGPVSASGLGELLRTFTNLPVEVDEFTGAETPVLRPARMGSPLGRILGRTCRLPAAGIEVIVSGGSETDARGWAEDPVRRRSLHLLALVYIGSPSPAVRLFLTLAPDNVPPAALDGKATLGGMAVLGRAERPVRLPLVG